jgi:hypothetical protein
MWGSTKRQVTKLFLIDYSKQNQTNLDSGY